MTDINRNNSNERYQQYLDRRERIIAANPVVLPVVTQDKAYSAFKTLERQYSQLADLISAEVFRGFLESGGCIAAKGRDWCHDMPEHLLHELFGICECNDENSHGERDLRYRLPLVQILNMHPGIVLALTKNPNAYDDQLDGYGGGHLDTVLETAVRYALALDIYDRVSKIAATNGEE